MYCMCPLCDHCGDRVRGTVQWFLSLKADSSQMHSSPMRRFLAVSASSWDYGGELAAMVAPQDVEKDKGVID